MNNSLINNSITNSSTIKKDSNDNNNILHFIFELIRNNQEIFIMIFYILLTIFILEFSLICYLQKKKITIWELCNNNCFDKRLKRKKNLIIEMGSLSHSSVT
jgi:hypothetical protein